MRMPRFGVPALVLALTTGSITLFGQQRTGAPGEQGGGGQAAQLPRLVMATMSFEDGGILPQKYAGQMGVSPQLSWKEVAPGVQSFVLLMRDPDVALQKTTADVTHWLVWNIPGT